MSLSLSLLYLVRDTGFKSKRSVPTKAYVHWHWRCGGHVDEESPNRRRACLQSSRIVARRDDENELGTRRGGILCETDGLSSADRPYARYDGRLAQVIRVKRGPQCLDQLYALLTILECWG